VDAVGKGPIVPADGEPTAATVIEGIPHHLGLREITYHFIAATKAAEGGNLEYTVGGRTFYPRAEDCTPSALNALYAEWEAWHRSMRPKIPEGEHAAIDKALAG
jgi:hypothetical protein